MTLLKACRLSKMGFRKRYRAISVELMLDFGFLMFGA